MSQKISFAAIVAGVKSRKDRTFKVELDTQELGGDAAKLFAAIGSQGWVLFSPNDDLTETDIPELKADAGLGHKTPSARLRAVLRVYWEQKGQPTDWPVFYDTQMERLINTVKEKLDAEK